MSDDGATLDRRAPQDRAGDAPRGTPGDSTPRNRSERATVCTDGGTEPTDRKMAALVGGGFTFGMAIIPILGPVLGGGIAGYLRGSNAKESTLTGMLANAVGVSPLILLAGFMFVFGTLESLLVEGGTSEAIAGLWVYSVLFGVPIVYFLICGALGGLVGAVLTDRGDPLADAA